MIDQLAKRRALVKRAIEAGIPNAMKTKSAELMALLGETEESVMTEPTSTPEPTTDPNADPEAPYGRKADGTPKARPGRKPADGSAPRQTAPKPGRKAPATRARATATPDYRAGISGVLQVPTAALAMAGRFKPELTYDAAAIAVHTPSIAEALNSLAQEEPRVAAVLDRVLAIGPYGAIVGVMITLTAQIAVNHKRLPVEAGAAFGAVEPDTLMASIAPTA